MHPEIIKICKQLQAEGKRPTVALVKAKLSLKVPMKEIIRTIQQAKLDPSKVLQHDDPSQDCPQLSLEETIYTLIERIEHLEDEVAHLKQQLKTKN